MTDHETGGERYGQFLDAVADGEGYYLVDRDGDGFLPPKVTDAFGSAGDLTRRPLPETGKIEAVTVVSVPPSGFADDVPYALAVVDMGPVRLTGQVCGADPEAVAVGQTVSPTVLTAETTDERLLGFTPTEES